MSRGVQPCAIAPHAVLNEWRNRAGIFLRRCAIAPTPFRVWRMQWRKFRSKTGAPFGSENPSKKATTSFKWRKL